jgi:hypothetical protein
VTQYRPATIKISLEKVFGGVSEEEEEEESNLINLKR